MTNEEMIRGYEVEIQYQKHMLENIGRWFSLAFLITSVSLIVLYFFHTQLLPTIIGTIFAFVGGFAMLLFGYVSYKGKKNFDNLVADFREKCQVK